MFVDGEISRAIKNSLIVAIEKLAILTNNSFDSVIVKFKKDKIEETVMSNDFKEFLEDMKFEDQKKVYTPQIC